MTKSINEKVYYRSVRSFLNFHFRAPTNETRSARALRLQKLNGLLAYCKDNYTRIGEGEAVDSYPSEVRHLLEINPIHISRWLKDLAYHKAEPSPDDRPLFARSSTLQAHKRNLSYYMPLNNMQWDPIQKRGNPTRDMSLNKTIQQVTQFELKGQGAKARDARALEFEEFCSVIKVSRGKVMPRGKVIFQYVHTAFLLLQYHLCGRTDDIVLFDIDEIRKNKYGFLDIKLCASKNIYKHEDSYWQVVFGCMDSGLCTIIGLGAYVGFFNEGELEKHENRQVKKTNEEREPKLPGFFRCGQTARYSKSSLNSRLQRICKNILKLIGRTSTHSIRKASAHEMQLNNCSREVSEQRGRWVQHGKGKPSNVYFREFMRPGDFEAAAALTGPLGIAKYTGDVTEEIAHTILPAAKSFLPGVAVQLAHAVIWAFHQEDETHKLLPDQLCRRIKEYENIHGKITATREKVNYVQDGKLAKIVPDDGTAEMTATNCNEQMTILYNDFKSFKRKYNEDEKLRVMELKGINKKLKLIQTSVNRGHLCNRSRTANKTGFANLSSLRNVATIHSIWEEYKYGNSGNKAVELFTKAEIRKVKDKWCLRNNAILALKLIISKGIDIHTACDRLQDVYQWGILGKASCLRSIGNDYRRNNLLKYFERYSPRDVRSINESG